MLKMEYTMSSDGTDYTQLTNSEKKFSFGKFKKIFED